VQVDISTPPVRVRTKTLSAAYGHIRTYTEGFPTQLKVL